MSKCVLVTGCAGFIGSALSKRLIEDGYSVIGVDNFNDYYDVELKKDRIKSIGNLNINFKYYTFDISSKESLSTIFKLFKFDYVINLAAQAGVRYSFEHPDEYINTNIVGFFNVIDLCKEYNCKLLYASSSSVYGNGKCKNEDESFDKPLNLYAATKMCDEQIAESYWNIHKLSSVGLRFFSVYGEWGRPDMLPMLVADSIRKNQLSLVYNNGENKRDFTYIDDIIDGIVLCIENFNEGHNVYNIGRGESVSTNKVISLIEKYLRRKVIKEYSNTVGEAEETLSNTSKLKSIGYAPKVSIEEGLKRFCDWYIGYYDLYCPDCTKCSDFEYCAFDYDKCTGYTKQIKSGDN